MSDRDVVKRHLASLLAEAQAKGIPEEMVGRMLLDEILALWRQQRTLKDLAAELRYTFENLDPDMDPAFMRP